MNNSAVSYHPLPTLVLFSALIVFMAACSSSYSGKADIGSNEIIVPGQPFATLNVSSNITEDQQTQAILYLSIEEGSLIYKKQQDSLINRIALQVQILSEDNEPLVSNLYQLLLGKSPDSKYYDQNTTYRRFTYGVPPGDHEVKISITALA